VPEVQNPVVGAEVNDWLLEEPQEPDNRAEQLAVLPPPVPAHVQFHGPAPVIDDAVPVAHSPVVGSEVVERPLAVPQAPFSIEFPDQELIVSPLARVIPGEPAGNGEGSTTLPNNSSELLTIL
jgi:hypothetical protein